MGDYHIVFDGPPIPEAGRFVEVEDDQGHSIAPGYWTDRGDGFWELILPRPDDVAGGPD